MFTDFTDLKLERSDKSTAIHVWRSSVVQQEVDKTAQLPATTEPIVDQGLARQVKNIHDNNLAMKSTLAKHLVKSNQRLDTLTSSLTQIEAQVEHFRQDRQRLVCREDRLSPAVRIDACKQFVAQVDEAKARMGEECKLLFCEQLYKHPHSTSVVSYVERHQELFGKMNEVITNLTSIGDNVRALNRMTDAFQRDTKQKLAMVMRESNTLSADLRDELNLRYYMILN